MNRNSLSAEIARISEPYEPDNYADIDLNRLATYMINKLSENEIVATFENIVAALFWTFPEKFSLPGYPEFPDATRVNRALLQLRPKYRNWAVGSNAKGYTLTGMGRRVALQAQKLLKSPPRERAGQRSVPPPPRTFYDGVQGQIRGSTAFKKYAAKQGEDVARPEIFELLGAVPYTPPKDLRGKIHDWSQLAEQANDTEMLGFLKWLKASFSQIFSDKGKSSA